MTENRLPEAQRMFPFLYVDDVTAYLDFLQRAFAFETRIHEVDPADPEHVHAEAGFADALVMIGHAAPKWGTSSPRRLPALHAGTYVLVDDADAHCRRARAAGAIIESEPADKPWGHRMYTARRSRRASVVFRVEDRCRLTAR